MVVAMPKKVDAMLVARVIMLVSMVVARLLPG